MNPLSGQTVSRISYDYAVTLSTEDGDELQISSPLTLTTDKGGVTINPEELSVGAGALLQLLHQRVREVAVGDDGVLTATWESGTRVQVEPDPDYEAWTLTSSSGAMLVCGPGGTVTTWPERPG